MLKVQFLSKKYILSVENMDFWTKQGLLMHSENEIKYFLLIFQFPHKALKSKVPSNLSLAVVAILSAVRFGVLTLPLV